VRDFRADAPAELAAGIARALAKRANDRWKAASVMREALGGVALRS